MLEIKYAPDFLKKVEKIRDQRVKERVKKQIAKVVESPETGKPMSYSRKGTREVYIPPFRLSYAYMKQENLIIFLDLYHKDEQ